MLSLGAIQGVACLQINNRRNTHRAGGAVVDAGVGDGINRQRPDGDVATCQKSSRRKRDGRKERIYRVRKSAVVCNRLAGSDMLSIKISVADGAQSNRRGNAADVGPEAADGGSGRVVVHLVVALAEDPSLGVEHAGPCQMSVVRGDFSACGGIAHRIEANAEIAGRDRQAVAAAGDGHSARSDAWTRAVVVSAKDHVAGGDRRGGAHRDVLASHCRHVAGDDRCRRRNGHIVDRRKVEHARRRLGGRGNVDIVSGVGINAAVDACNGLVDIDVVDSIHGQRGGCGPGHRRIDIDIANRPRGAGVTF